MKSLCGSDIDRLSAGLNRYRMKIEQAQSEKQNRYRVNLGAIKWKNTE